MYIRIFFVFSKAGVDPAASSEVASSSSVLPDSMYTPAQQQQSTNLSTERISTTSHASSPVAGGSATIAVPSNGQPPTHPRMPTSLANGHRQTNMINPSATGVYPNREASFGNMPPTQQLANPLLFDNVTNLLPGTSGQIMVGQPDSSSQMFLQGQLQHQQMDTMMGGNNKNLQPQEVMLNLMKEYGNPEQIGSLFDQQMADPFNIQMSLPLMDYFD